MKKMTTAEFRSEVLQGKGTFLVDFFADWCGPCKMMAPVLERFQAKHPEITVCKVNVDEEMEVAVEYGVQSIPMLLVFRDGQIVNKTIGFTPENELEKLF